MTGSWVAHRNKGNIKEQCLGNGVEQKRTPATGNVAIIAETYCLLRML